MILTTAKGISSRRSLAGLCFTFSSAIKQVSTLSFFLACLPGVIQAAPLAPAPTALPTNGQVVAGSATISQTQTPTTATMNVNQSSQRAVINWDSFNVGKNATVNFNQPNASAVTLNRVTGATQSMIDGAIKANGQVIFVNPNGVTFGRGAEVNAAGVVASTMNIADKDFMDGKSTFKGNSTGAVINEGKIKTNVEGGYIALLAPEVRNEGYLLAKKGSGTVAMASGEQVTLDFKGNSLVSIKVDIATYNGLIENKRVVEVNGGLVVLAAGAANQLMAGVIRNTGRISASSAVNNGGVIELVANTVNQAGKLSANSKAAEGGQINLVGSDITLATNSKTTATGATGGGQVNVGLANTQVSGGMQINSPTQAGVKANASQAAINHQLAQTVLVQEGALIDASATQSGNGGVIAIWSQVQTTVAGILKSMGGVLSGNGGFIETSSAGRVIYGQSLEVDTRAPQGKYGNWYTDPTSIVIDAPAAIALTNALANTNVTLDAMTSACGPIGSCASSSTAVISFLANVLSSNPLTSLYLYADNGTININSTIQAGAVYAQAQGGTINVGISGKIWAFNDLLGASSGSLGYAIELLAQAIYVSGGLSTTSSVVGGTAGNMKLLANTINLGAGSKLEANGDHGGGLIMVAANDSIYSEGLIQANGTIGGNGGTIALLAANAITIDYFPPSTSPLSQQLMIQANGSASSLTSGGTIILATVAGNLSISNAIIQAAQSAAGGVGGDIALTATNNLTISNSQIDANGSAVGGIALLGDTTTLSTNVDGHTIINVGGSGYFSVMGKAINSQAITPIIMSSAISSSQIASFSSQVSANEGTLTASAATSATGTSATGTSATGTSATGTTATGTSATGTTSPAVVTAPPPPPPAPPPAVFSIPVAKPAPAKLEIVSTKEANVAPAAPVAPEAPPSAAKAEVAAPPAKAAPLSVLADGSIQLTPPAAPNAPAEAPPPAAANPPPARPSSSARESANKEGSSNKDGTNPESRKYGSNKDGTDKADGQDGSTKSTTGSTKYVSKYANGVRNTDKPGTKEGSNKPVAGTKPNAPREGKYANRINAVNNNPAAIATMRLNPFAGNISAFPPGVATEVMPAPVIRGGDSLAQSYDDVPSIRNSGVANAGRSRSTENYYESLESVNLMSTLNLFIIH
ncbi:filamentous hemagglutinin N-terminal domain-containing protein [Polynucleobacter sp. MWH-Creno-3A4]|uniref:two-partner secretion domain-containing protein n=1 Tax=Polynucleobacter sp. MWH-Creno-3A4 TaxID=1855886 RepID=UPI001C0B777E|nr:filamentous hemagglutinin N-terminal domain-containing protein [Polynucleobacter sp. MWH-Creno-3A4]MBU3605165.1 filamentous hemagglutinin N-terminal domain-containing protein [Polynucleobacter sp. MWH-Creno-3A4]